MLKIGLSQIAQGYLVASSQSQHWGLEGEGADQGPRFDRVLRPKQLLSMRQSPYGDEGRGSAPSASTVGADSNFDSLPTWPYEPASGP